MVSNRSYQVEVCVVSLMQAMEATSKGADRIELCVRLETEGMTPEPELVEEVLNRVHVPVRVMVRETESGFEADEGVLESMIRSVEMIKRLPIDGFVLGVLRNQKLDREAMMLLLDHAAPLPVTVHKALDLSAELTEDLKWLNRFPQVDTILTSGGALKAVDGVKTMLQMKSIFQGTIMGAGKITPGVLPGLHQRAGLPWYHGRSIL